MSKYIESNTVELKSKLSNSLCKEIVSFLNADGGKILIGIDDKGSVIGVDEIDNICKSIADIITTQIEPNPQEIVKTELLYDEGKTIVCINIQKGINPIYCQKKYGFSSTGCTIRIGTTCREMTQEQIRIRYEKRFFGSDLLVASPTYLGGLTFKILKIYYAEKGFHLDDNTFEANLFLRNNRNEYNKLAELMADENPNSLIFVKFNGKDKSCISQRSDYGNQCIIFAYEQLKNRLISENVCTTDTTVRPRIDKYLYDFDCVNEALINAIIHNDWRISEPLVCFYVDRLEIISHGGLPHNLSKEQFYKGISIPKNSKLMRIFRDIGIAEHTRHGIPRIISKYSKEAFEITDSYINVVIPFDKEVLHNSNGGINGGIKLSHLEEQIINILLENKNVSVLKISEMLEVSKRTIERNISSLQTKGIIERIGSNRIGHWKILK